MVVASLRDQDIKSSWEACVRVLSSHWM